MKIPDWIDPNEQTCRLGCNEWKVARLLELSRKLPVMRVPLDHLDVYHTYDNLSLRELVMHMAAVQDADLRYPILLDEDGALMDGRHRIMRAILEGKKTILARRFDENPTPDRHHGK